MKGKETMKGTKEDEDHEGGTKPTGLLRALFSGIPPWSDGSPARRGRVKFVMR